MSDGWEGLLASDEVVLWQGTPEGRVRAEWSSPFQPFFFLFFTGFSVFWMTMASKAGGFFWTFGLLFFGVGVFNLIGIHFWKAYVRRHLQYTLTNRRAFIGNSTFGKRKLDSYPITGDTSLSFEDGQGVGDVYFAEKFRRTKNGTTVTRIGFEQITDARTVMGMMQYIQTKGDAA